MNSAQQEMVVGDVTLSAHVVETEVDAGALGGGGEGHGFDFMVALNHHNMPYPAIEWIHWSPTLIFNLPKYVFLDAAHWAAAGSELSEAEYGCYLSDAGDADLLAKFQQSIGDPNATELEFAQAMAAANDSSWLGTAPSFLSWVNQQTFFGTCALIFMALVLTVWGKRKPDELKPTNRIQHMIEAVVLFVRDDIVRPNVHHGADAWVPHIAAIFFAVLSMNLMGLIPGTGTATGNIGVTAAFASMTLAAMIIFGMKKQGAYHFWRNLIPVPFSPKPLDLVIFMILAVIEVMGLLIKPAALAIRLFANMFGGHTVLLAFTALGYVVHSAGTGGGLTLALGGFGIVVSIAVYLLELLVAFLQAYVFTLLTAVFIGASLEAEH